MFWKTHRRAKAGTRIRAHQMNDMQRAAENFGKLSATSPLGLQQTPGGPNIYWAAASPYLRYFLPTSGPIPAATGTAPNISVGVGQATAYFRDPASNQLTSWQYTVNVVNWVGTAVGDVDRFLLCAFVDGDWTVVAEACS